MRLARALGFGSLVVPALAVMAASPGPPQAVFGRVTLRADPQHYTGACPANIRFIGSVAVEHKPMQFNYVFERSDGSKGAPQVVHVAANGQSVYPLTEPWQLGAPGHRQQVWMRLKVASGSAKAESVQAHADINCH